mmetsp:Transcript_33630/g.64400  ORF Transcript_33630/g.64400 Transcript_33630/m.64400 type:complete len:265 (-) Transcript_33630:189-983(-)
MTSFLETIPINTPPLEVTKALDSRSSLNSICTLYTGVSEETANGAWSTFLQYWGKVSTTAANDSSDSNELLLTACIRVLLVTTLTSSSVWSLAPIPRIASRPVIPCTSSTSGKLCSELCNKGFSSVVDTAGMDSDVAFSKWTRERAATTRFRRSCMDRVMVGGRSGSLSLSITSTCFKISCRCFCTSLLTSCKSCIEMVPSKTRSVKLSTIGKDLICMDFPNSRSSFTAVTVVCAVTQGMSDTGYTMSPANFVSSLVLSVWPTS